MPGAVDTTSSFSDAFLWVGGICLAFFVGITATLILFVVKYRRSRNPKPTSKAHGNLPLEIGWIVVPTLLALVMFVKGYEGFLNIRTVPGDAMAVDVLARRWSWTFRYPEHDISSDRLHVPVGRAVRLEITSPPDDVVHSLFIPEYRVKEDAVPGRTTYLWFRPTEVGTYNIFCAEFCGTGHSGMLSAVVVMEEEDFDKWVERTIADKNKPVDIEVAMNPDSDEITERDGKRLFLTYCASCHGEKGEGGLTQGARDFTRLDGWKQSPKITDIFRTLSEGIEGTQMRAFTNLVPWDRFAVAHHVASFYRGADRPESAPEERKQLVKDYRLDQAPASRRRIPIEKAMRLIIEERETGD